MHSVEIILHNVHLELFQKMWAATHGKILWLCQAAEAAVATVGPVIMRQNKRCSPDHCAVALCV